MRVAALLGVLFLTIVAPVMGATKWTQVRTPHYLLLGDARAGDIRAVAQRFEQFHGVMQRVLSRAAVTSSAPTVVLVFANERSFSPYQPVYDGKRANVGGLFLGASDINYVAMNVEGGASAYPTIFHELTHLFVGNAVRHPPMWFNEGLAEYYSTFEMRGRDKVILGRPVMEHIGLLRERFLPMRDLLLADDYTALHNDRGRLGVFYAQSWALVHLLRGNPATRDRFSDYLRRVSAGATADGALEQAFGLDLAAIEKALRRYVRQYQMSAEMWTLDSALPESAAVSSDASEATVLGHLARVLMRQDRLDAADERLAAALKLEPENGLVLAMLAQLRLQQKRPADTWKILTGAKPTGDFFSEYLFGYALLDYAEHVGWESRETEAAIAPMRERLSTAARLDGTVAEAWHALTHAHLLAGELTEAEAAITRALDLAPAREYYRLALAEVLGRRREFARARATLGELLARGRTPDVRERARRLLGNVANVERAQLEVETLNAERASAGGAEREESRLVPAFRGVKPDETRVFGRLIAIECARSGVTLVVEANGDTLRVVAPGFDQVEFVTYRQDLQGQVSCTKRVPPDPVYVTWRGGAPKDGKVQTPAAVVEFTPKGFVP